jgi:hypothetical protein
VPIIRQKVRASMFFMSSRANGCRYGFIGLERLAACFLAASHIPFASAAFLGKPEIAFRTFSRTATGASVGSAASLASRSERLVSRLPGSPLMSASALSASAFQRSRTAASFGSRLIAFSLASILWSTCPYMICGIGTPVTRCDITTGGTR